MPFTGILKDWVDNTDSGQKQTDEKMHCNNSFSQQIKGSLFSESAMYL